MRIVLVLAALVFGVAAHAAPLQVVATLPTLAAVAREIGGANVQVQALVSPRQDPHYADARPNFIVALNRADLLLVNGLQLEIGWLPPLIGQARNAKIAEGGAGYFDASAFVRLQGAVKGPLDRAKGDIHPGGNPHFLYDPRAVAQIGTALGQTLGKADPPHAAEYAQNAAKLAAALQALAANEKARFDALPAAKKRFVAYHESLTYLVSWLGLQQIATLEPRPGIAPDPTHVAQVLQAMKSQGIAAILQEEFYPQSTAKTLAGMTQSKIGLLPGSTRLGEETVAAHLKAVAAAVFVALQ